MRAREAEKNPSLDGAAGTSRPLFISRIGVGAVASVREGQVDVEPHKFHCSTGIMVPGGEDSEPHMMGTVLDSGARISCVSEATVCALLKRFPGSTWFNLMTVSSIRWCSRMGGLYRLNGRRAH